MNQPNTIPIFSNSLNENIPKTVQFESDLHSLRTPKGSKVFVEELKSYYTFSGSEWILTQVL